MKFLFWLISAPVLLIILGIAGTELNKAYWDRRVSQLCAEDGGVHLIEKIVIRSDQIDDLGQVAGFVTMASKEARPNSPAYKDRTETIIRISEPKVYKVEEHVFRAADAKQTGSLISYHRVGGDFPTGIASASSYSCPEGLEYYAIQEQFFQIQGNE